MDGIGELRAVTDDGATMVAAAERFAAEFRLGALAADASGSFAVDHLDKLRADRFLIATVPAGLGGGGVTSVHDLLVAASRLARTDVATAIGVNMHFAVLHNVVRAWSVAVERWDERAAERMSDLLRLVVASDTVFAAAVSEPSPQDLARPSTVAVRGADGWSVSGTKAFATMAQHATVLSVAITFPGGRGDERYGFASIPVGSPGVVFHDDWDALGMRASASGSVSFSDVRVPDSMLADICPAGLWSADLMDRYLVSGALHAAASLGIAEGAVAAVVGRLGARAGSADDPYVIAELSGLVIDLAAMQASLARSGTMLDDYFAAHRSGDVARVDAQRATAAVQAAKAFLNAASVRVVDRALALTGGAGYRAGDPLAKAWRDVRAGALMHPIGANRVGPFIARAALGLAP